MEKAIKQRLLGGLVLVAGAALFLPVLLDGSGAGLTIPPLPTAPETAGVEAMAPALDEQVAATEKEVDAAHAEREAAESVPVGEGEVAPDAAALAGAAPQAAAPAPRPQASVPAPAKPAVDPAPVARPAPKVAPAPAPLPKPVAPAPAPAAKPAAKSPLPEAWAVQVAVLSSRDKAEALVRKLRAKNYPAVLKPHGGNWKVMVGPEFSRDVAESAKARMAADPELRLSGWVQSYNP